jgi:hypothetical protein
MVLSLKDWQLNPLGFVHAFRILELIYLHHLPDAIVDDFITIASTPLEVAPDL